MKKRQRKFHERFNIEVTQDEAQRRFVNRVHNMIFREILEHCRHYERDYEQINRRVVSAIGEVYRGHQLTDYLEDDLHRNLTAIEVLYEHLPLDRKRIEDALNQALDQSESDIGVRWKDGQFYPAGAKLLDRKTVNEVLDWLREREYANVLAPFEKALEHLLQSQKNPKFLADVITDMYEALEAMAKIVTGSKKDLSANQELFIKKVNASDGYKKILREYVQYGCDFRHALEEGKKRPRISAKEAESFIYLTGVFIRLAMP